MNFVEPIRDLSKLDDILAWLKARSLRDWLLFLTGVLTGIRISDGIYPPREGAGSNTRL